MPRYQGSTTERGYGAPHQALRKRLLARWRPGDPCARCGRPMLHRWRIVNGRRVPAIQLGHDDHDRTRYRGLEHAYCNLAAGARQLNRRKTARRWAAARRW